MVTVSTLQLKSSVNHKEEEGKKKKKDYFSCFIPYLLSIRSIDLEQEIVVKTQHSI